MYYIDLSNLAASFSCYAAVDFVLLANLKDFILKYYLIFAQNNKSFSKF